MKPRYSLPLLALLIIALSAACKKSSGGKEPYELSNTSWQGEAKMFDKNFKPMKVSFKEDKTVEVVFVSTDATPLTYTFFGTWQKSEDSDNVVFIFAKGVDKVTCTCTLSDNNTKLPDGKFKVDNEPNLDAGTFSLTRQ